ncbi:MAG: hypothetical protein ACI4BD_01215 [Paludibacteraceae bacterium]
MERNIYVAGNYIAEQHIGTQIFHADTVYTSDPQPRPSLRLSAAEEAEEVTPVQERPAPKKSAKKSPKPSPYFLETPTFVYRYGKTRQEDSKRLTILYQYLIKEYGDGQSYLAQDTPPEDFYSLFTGEQSKTVLVWTGTKQDLYYFVKRMVERDIISVPAGWYVWQIVANHFSDRRGNPFRSLRHQHLPKVSAPALERLIDILDPAAYSPAE